MAECRRLQNVLFFIPTLEAGGAERVCLNFVNNLRRHRAVVLLQQKRGALMNELGPGIAVLEMFGPHRAGGERAGRWTWAGRLRETIRGLRFPIMGQVTKVLGKAAWRLGCGKLSRWPLRNWGAGLLQAALWCLRRIRGILVAGTRRVKPGAGRVASRLTRTLPGLLRRTAAAYYLFSLLWQARKLAVLTRRHECVAVASFITLPNLLAVLSKRLFHRRLKVVINVRDVTSRILVESGLKGVERAVLRWLVRKLYPRADAIVAAAAGIKRDLIENFGIAGDRIVVINNPIDLRRIRARAREPVDHPWFCRNQEPIVVAVGRLVKLKGYDFLIRAFAQLPPNLRARLVVLGEGRERSALERLIEESGLKNRVALLGFQENPWKYMARAHMLVLSSLTEGLPNAIGEAMALDLPILATDCSAGVREYVQNGENGLLVPPGSVAALARGMGRMIGERQLCVEMRHRSRARIERFDLPRIISAYEDVLERTIAE